MVTQRYGRRRPQRPPARACLLAGLLVGVAGLVAGCSGGDATGPATGGSSGVQAVTGQSPLGTAAVPASGAPLVPPGAPGEKIPAATVVQLGGVYSSVTEIADPRQLPDTWQDLDTSTVAGPTSVQGVAVKSYRAQLEPDVAFGLMPTELRTPQLKAAFQKLDSVQTLSVDSAGRPVQVVTEVTGRIAADGRKETVHQVTSIRYSDWGKPVTITVPGSSTSYDLAKATGMK